jgi:hypothetical protein
MKKFSFTKTERKITAKMLIILHNANQYTLIRYLEIIRITSCTQSFEYIYAVQLIRENRAFRHTNEKTEDFRNSF